MFYKILIANRGEIACRVIATCRKMGVRTVAVYSDADARARHVSMADEAVWIGAAPVQESYLRAERIIDAALQTGAQTIHPGYGFLSENPDFVEQVEAAGLTFIGPPADAIRAMGLKDAAKALMERAGVPVVPGYHGDSQDPEELACEADRIGYPVLIKARAGGGGKGMRRVDDPAEFQGALQSAQREAQASFGDPACLIEKYITTPRHIEIQVFADGHGNVVHLFERDCSLQRRHQKVIEEAPAPDMPEDVRTAMGHAAVEAARAIGYEGAGTVEFIADGSGPLRSDGFWFMEMNTRLQVEHPVTEAITWLDLVEWQLRVAAGEPLPLGQDDLHIDGHAIEARLYAEDPATGFLPAIGTISALHMPKGAAFGLAPVRIDAGVTTGDAITPHYDPMIAKLIVHAPDRPAALARMAQALAQTSVAGLTTNLPFLARLIAHPDFQSGQVDTGLIEHAGESLTSPAPLPETVRALAHLAALGLVNPTDSSDPWDKLRGWRAWGRASHESRLTYAGDEDRAEVTITPDGMLLDDKAYALHVETDAIAVISPTGQTTLRMHRSADQIEIFDRADRHVFTIPDPLAGTGEAVGTSDILRAPMPGQVTRVLVAEGQDVADGQALLILEAMKMEHTITAPRDGTIAEMSLQQGDQVTADTMLIKLEPEDG